MAVTFEIREERDDDVDAIREVNRRAFGQDLEGAIVDALRANDAASLSLVATVDDRVVGHIMFSPVSIADRAHGVGLGPMAVMPDYQRRGIGGQLIAAGLAHFADAGCPFVVVLGHAEYYPRFGFTPARSRGVTCEWDVPDEVFMIRILDEARMAGVSGLAKYRDEFSAAS